MYEIQRKDIEYLKELEKENYDLTVFTTFEWVSFLEKNQHAKPVILQVMDQGELLCVFVGLVISKFGIRILGSPFEGWITEDMGFIKIVNYDFNQCLNAVSEYAFKHLGCMFCQIVDKKVTKEMISNKWKYSIGQMLHIDNSKLIENVLQNFTKNGRRDVRASERKGLQFVRVCFDEAFTHNYYQQLKDVFEKQQLNPFYSEKKILDLVDAFKNKPDDVLALEARLDDKCVATLLSFGHGKWAYYVGAASYREYQKHLPNEGLFWMFIKYWNERGVENIDLCGYRKYKMKYNPEVIEYPVIMIERIKGMITLKKYAKKTVASIRRIKGIIRK